MQAATGKPSTYLTHVNGLRALAILGVLIYHLNAPYCPAGYFGVDVFLVISGYFLLASLMKAEKPGDIHYGSFLLKKSWRILLPWLLVTVVFCVGSGAFMLPLDRDVICNTAFRGGYFAADFYIDNLYDYFNQTAHSNLFLHYWYLSITGQMYIIIPLLVMLLLKLFSKRGAVVVLGGIALLSLAFYVLTTTPQVPEELRKTLLASTGMKTTYYHLLPRLWEVLVGGGILLLPAWQGRRGLRILLETLGGVGLVASFFWFETGSAQVYVAVLSGILFIRYGGEGALSRLLSWRPFQWVGTISFSLYLWHWPIMASWKYIKLGEINWADELGMVLLSLVVSALAWALVERVKMPAATSRLKLCLRFLPVALLLLFLSGIRPYYKSIRAASADALKAHGILPDIIRQLNERPADEELMRGFDTKAYEQKPAWMGTASTAEPSFMLLGDSHSTHLYLGLEKYCNDKGLRGIFLNNHVSPLWWCYKDHQSNWNEARAEALLAYLEAHPEVRYVFIAMLWDMRLHGSPQNNGGVTMDWREMKSLSQKEQDVLRERGLEETCRRLSAMGCRVVLLADVPLLPIMPSPYEKWLKVKMLTGKDCPEHLTPVADHRKRFKRCDALFARLAKDGAAWAVIDCAEGLRRGEAYATRNAEGKFLYYDHNHLTRLGSEQVAAYIMGEWERLKAAEKPGTEEPQP